MLRFGRYSDKNGLLGLIWISRFSSALEVRDVFQWRSLKSVAWRAIDENDKQRRRSSRCDGEEAKDEQRRIWRRTQKVAGFG